MEHSEASQHITLQAFMVYTLYMENPKYCNCTKAKRSDGVTMGKASERTKYTLIKKPKSISTGTVCREGKERVFNSFSLITNNLFKPNLFVGLSFCLVDLNVPSSSSSICTRIDGPIGLTHLTVAGSCKHVPKRTFIVDRAFHGLACSLCHFCIVRIHALDASLRHSVDALGLWCRSTGDLICIFLQGHGGRKSCFALPASEWCCHDAHGGCGRIDAVDVMDFGV